ncbi:MAG: DUF1593 domain-containing protein [Planctomycetaceae bacterium]
MTSSWLAVLVAVVCSVAFASPAADRPRVIVSTDAGGTDYDDLQSLVHLLLCADVVDIEGLVSSPYGPGRARHIHEVIDVYARDHARLARHSAHYPHPDALRAMTVQGAVESAGAAGFAASTEGSRWIIERARHDDPRPLWVLVWGGIDDLAQALHDAPDILPRLRVHFIGGPNKKWSAPAYDLLVRDFPGLWMIESNSTYRGWFTGGDQEGDLGNDAFVERHAAGHGALGDYFATGIVFRGERRSRLKMGDTPSLAYLLHGDIDRPGSGSWGGAFVRAWDRRRVVWRRPPAATDVVETFRTVELALPASAGLDRAATAMLELEGQPCPGDLGADGSWHFWFCPKESRAWRYAIASGDPAIDGITGTFRSEPPDPARRNEPAADFPAWWTDDPDPVVAEGPHQGARTVSRWRREFLGDLAARFDRCLPDSAVVSGDRADR